MNEEQLIELSKDGDLLAFEELVIKYQNKIYTLAFRYMGNEEDACDAAQEVFLKAYRSLHTFKGRANFSTWLYRVATNICLDELRRRKRRIRPLSLDEPLTIEERDSMVDLDIIDTAPSTYELYEKKLNAQYINNILNEMKKEHKTILVLKDMLEYSYAEIAMMLDCSSGTVKSRLIRARTVFKQKAGQLEWN